MSTPTPHPSHTFDTPSALSGLYLWLLFGFFTSLLGCDLQRLVTQNMFVKHFLALVCFFFLFTLLDPNNRAGIGQVWLKTVLVYILFVMSTRSKAWASIAVVVILIIDQTVKMHINYLMTQEGDVSCLGLNCPLPIAEQISRFNKLRRLLYMLIVVIIVAGFIHYYMYQKREWGSDFNMLTFLFGVPKCREM
jgi:hypothetical protein